MEINDPGVLTQVTVVLRRYEDALVANDVAVLNELFWDNPLPLRYGITENLYGHDASYGRDFATTNIEFRRAGRHGRQSQTWARMPEGWRIVAAHVSYMDDSRSSFCRRWS